MIDISTMILRVEKSLYIETNESGNEDIGIGWTTNKPKHFRGKLDKGAILIFSDVSSMIDTTGNYPLNFMYIYNNENDYPVNFAEGDIQRLVKENALLLLEQNEMSELSICLGQVIRNNPYEITGYDTEVLSPRDLYVIMSVSDMKRSNRKVVVGDKIPLEHIIQVYTEAIGKNLIPK